MNKILHITTHMGGGVGKALSGIAKYNSELKNKYIHRILLLEKPEKDYFIKQCKENQVEVIVSQCQNVIVKEIMNADIVQLEWWHHPLMAGFLTKFPEVDMRLIIWSHISGCTYPNIPFEFLKIPEVFIFTSKYSYENPMWNSEQKQWALYNTKMVNSSGGFREYSERCLVKHQGFNIGYIGTLNYSKLNPKVYDFYQSIDIQDSRFIMIGEQYEPEKVTKELISKNLYKKVIFKDYVENVAKELQHFDVFSYILNPSHFGTTENALLEAMASGLPVIALNQNAEKHIIDNGETGILVNNIEEYKKSILYLYNNPEERKRLGSNAKKLVLDKFSGINTVNKLNDIYDDILYKPKKKYYFSEVFGTSPCDWFKSCLGIYSSLFEEDKIKKNYCGRSQNKLAEYPYILKEKGKSSISQFYKYYPEDKQLELLNRIIME